MTTRTNSWINRTESDSVKDHAADRPAVYKDAPLDLANDTTWHVVLIVIGLIGAVLFWWKNSYAGWDAATADIAVFILLALIVGGIWRADRHRFGK